MWGDFESKRKVHWVGWDHICSPFSLGGLGVKNIKYFNLDLLLKWKWRILEKGGVVEQYLCGPVW